MGQYTKFLYLPFMNYVFRLPFSFQLKGFLLAIYTNWPMLNPFGLWTKLYTESPCSCYCCNAASAYISCISSASVTVPKRLSCCAPAGKVNATSACLSVLPAFPIYAPGGVMPDSPCHWCSSVTLDSPPFSLSFVPSWCFIPLLKFYWICTLSKEILTLLSLSCYSFSIILLRSSESSPSSSLPPVFSALFI